MKKPKRQPRVEANPTPTPSAIVWWPWAAALAALFVGLEAYGPAVNGAFVFDDRSLPFFNPELEGKPLLAWLGFGGNRPLLMLSFFADHSLSGEQPYFYHLTNVVLHFFNSVLVTWIAALLLARVDVEGRTRNVLAVFAGGLFLLHPLQTESVAYVASRSENLSVLFYLGAFALALQALPEGISWGRAVSVTLLFVAAVMTKEHTLTLPALILLADLFFNPGGWRKNYRLYAVIAVAAAVGAVFVWRVLSGPTAGFRVEGLPPSTYFFTQCRVVWNYVRLFFLPFGQNVDWDVALSGTILAHGALAGLVAIVAAIAAAWYYRKSFPLAAFGILAFLLLIAPTSSVVPIRDVMAERRLYLPFPGLALVCVEALRRLKLSTAVWASMAILMVCAGLTYQRNQVWASPMALWQDAAAKSPQKVRPRFQFAYANYELGRCPQAAESYEMASKLGPLDVPLLVDWALALDCAGRSAEAIDKLEQASKMEPSAHIFSVIGMVYGKQRKSQEALAALEMAERLDPRFEMTYVYRGNVYEVTGDRAAAAREYQRVLAMNPANQAAREALARVSR